MWHKLDEVDLIETSNKRRIYLRVNANTTKFCVFILKSNLKGENILCKLTF